MTELMTIIGIIPIVVAFTYLAFIVGYVKGDFDCYREIEKNNNNEALNKKNNNNEALNKKK